METLSPSRPAGAHDAVILRLPGLVLSTRGFTAARANDMRCGRGNRNRSAHPDSDVEGRTLLNGGYRPIRRASGTLGTVGRLTSNYDDLIAAHCGGRRHRAAPAHTYVVLARCTPIRPYWPSKAARRRGPEADCTRRVGVAPETTIHASGLLPTAGRGRRARRSRCGAERIWGGEEGGLPARSGRRRSDGRA